MLCADVAPADGAAIQQTLKHLEEKLKSVGELCTSNSSANREKKISRYTEYACRPVLIVCVF